MMTRSGNRFAKPASASLRLAVPDDAVALTAQAREIVVANRDLVLDDGNELGG